MHGLRRGRVFFRTSGTCVPVLYIVLIGFNNSLYCSFSILYREDLGVRLVAHVTGVKVVEVASFQWIESRVGDFSI